MSIDVKHFQLLDYFVFLFMSAIVEGLHLVTVFSYTFAVLQAAATITAAQMTETAQ